jgi:hypothetical protein
MNSQRKGLCGFFLFLLVLLTCQVGCTGGSSGTADEASSDISNITEISSDSKSIAAAQGGTVALDEFTAIFPAAILPADAQVKVSKVSVSESEQDPSLIDMTNAYVLSTTSDTRTLELANSATIAFKINPAGFDETSIRLVVWEGYEWEEVPFFYDDVLKVVSSTVEAIMPFGTRIYLANPDVRSPGSPREREGGTQIVSEFVAIKVVGEISDNAVQKSASPRTAAAERGEVSGAGRPVFIPSKSGKFKVNYTQPANQTEADALKKKAEDVAGYMDNAYQVIVKEMGLREPGVNTHVGYGRTWPVKLRVLKGYYGSADSEKYQIYLNVTEPSGDGMAHTCHHEFTHLVQFRTLKDASIDVEDSLDWFGETMADGVGFYAQKGRGTIYSLADASMGYFDVRLDADNHSLGRDNNYNYEYRHFPFISYLLRTYGDTKFKNFFETWYSSSPPGKKQISMTTIDAAAQKGFEKTITGREGIYWDFYWDYFISGVVFNKDKFKNLPFRDSDKPFDIKEDEKEKQGVTIVEVSPKISYQKEFIIQRLAGQVAVLRYKGSSEDPLDISVKVSSTPGTSSGRIQLISFKRQGGILQPVGAVEEFTDGGTKTKEYAGVGTDIHDIYLVMANTSWKADDYKVAIVVTEKP